MRVAVIGAGPSGLVTLKYLVTAHQYHPVEPLEVRLFESKESVAGTFRYRVYEDAELVSSKYLTAFSDFRVSRDDPDFLPTGKFCSYLEDYTTHFDLWRYIELSTKVTNVRRLDRGGHVIRYSKDGTELEWDCDAVAVCSGLHVDPYVPSIPGIEHVPRVLHSSEFKQRKDFGVDKQVVVLGVGETAMDLSYLAITSATKSVTICHRDGFYYAPKVVPVPVIMGLWGRSSSAQQNIPTDTSVMSLFDTAYVHPILQKSSLIWDYYDFFVKRIFQLISGTMHGHDQWAGGISDERYHISRIYLCKSGRAVPYISAPYRQRSMLDRIRAAFINVPIKDTGSRTIDLAPWPEYIDSDGIVKFTDNGRPEAERMKGTICKPDIVVFATGYSQHFPFLDSTYPTPLEADRRGVWKTGDESVGFIGFVRPAIGAIPPLSELQAQLWILSLLNRLPPGLPRDIDYKLHFTPGRREYENYGVDHEAYAYQLALDMGSAPSFTEVLGHGFKTTFTWACGSNFNTKFRLMGPWKWCGAPEVMRTELWDVVKKSGGWFYITTYSIIPFVAFGTMSAGLWAGCTLLELIRRAGNRLLGTGTGTENNYGLGRDRKSVV